MSVIHVTNLTKKYNDTPAVNNLTFSVEKGEIFGLLGPNGAGKTTTIKLLTSQIRPDGGAIKILGFDALKEPMKIKEKMGVVFEEQNFYPRLTVAQNLRFFAKLYSIKQDRIDAVLEFVKLDHRKNDEAGKLSRGLKQRLLIARALIPEPELIFLDEPTVGLDPHVARDIRDLFRDLKKRGKTLFLTTHYMEEADELCDRIAIINEGTIVKLDTPGNLKRVLSPPQLIIEVLDENGQVIDSRVFDADGSEVIQYLEKMLAEGVKFKISSREVSLEDVFIHLTGAQLD